MAFCSKCGKELPEGATFCPACGTPVQATASAGAPSAAPAAPVSGIDALMKDSKAQEYWFRRLIALIIDGIIIGIVVVIIFALIAAMVALPAYFAYGYAPLSILFGGVTIVVGILLILYFPLAETTRGATIGKSVMHLKVVGKNGGNPNFVEAFVRNISKIYWLLLLLDVIVGLATQKGYQQKYSDHIMGTSVVPA